MTSSSDRSRFRSLSLPLLAALLAFGPVACAAQEPADLDGEVATAEDEIVAGRTYVIDGEMVEKSLPKVDFTDPDTFKNDAWKTPIVRRTGKQARVVARVLSIGDEGYDVDVTVRVEGEGARRQRTRLDFEFGSYGPSIWAGDVRSGTQDYFLQLQLLSKGNPKVWSLHVFDLARDLTPAANERSKELTFAPTTRFPVAPR